MLLAIDRMLKFNVVLFQDSAGKMEAPPSCAWSSQPSINTALTGLKATPVGGTMTWPSPIHPKNRDRYRTMRALFGGHIFDRGCKEDGIERD